MDRLSHVVSGLVGWPCSKLAWHTNKAPELRQAHPAHPTWLPPVIIAVFPEDLKEPSTGWAGMRRAEGGTKGMLKSFRGIRGLKGVSGVPGFPGCCCAMTFCMLFACRGKEIRQA